MTELATNPLLCTIIAIVYRNNRVLPNRRVALYLKCCEALLDTWERNKAIRESGLIGGYDWQTKLELLAPLAYWLHAETERLSAPEDQFTEKLAQVLAARPQSLQGRDPHQDARSFLSLIRDRSGLLQGRGDGTLEFAHRTFQEYLAARHIAAQPDPDYIDLVMAHLHEAWWREVHLLVIGHMGSSRDSAPRASALLLAILGRYRPPPPFLRSQPDIFLRRPARLIARIFPDWQLDRRLAWILAREFELATTGCLDCAPFGTTDDARNALFAAGERLLLQIVHDPGRFEKDGPQFTAAYLLGEQASSEFVATLTKALVDINDHTPNVQQALDDLTKRLKQFGLDDDDAKEVIATLATVSAPHQLVGEMDADNVDQPGQADPVVATEALAALVAPDRAVRWKAARNLGQLARASPEVVAALLATLADQDRKVRLEVAGSLGQLGQSSPEVVAALLAALADPDPYMRSGAADSLGQLGQAIPEVVAELVAALADRDVNVRKAAINSLGRLGQTGSEVVAALVAGLADRDMFVRVTAASSLGQLGDASPEVVVALVATLADRDSLIRNAAADSLGQLKISDGALLHSVMLALNRSLHDIRDDVRRSALEAARELLDGRPIPGSRWVPLAVRRARARRLKRIGFWTGIVAVTLVVTLGIAWLLTSVDANSLLGRFLLGLTIAVAFGSGMAQILGRALCDPWDKG